MSPQREPTIIRQEWRAEERADGCYVIETGFGIDGHIEYGPMPEETVLLLISECRDSFERALENAKAHLLLSLA